MILVGSPTERQSKEYIRKIGVLAQKGGIRPRRDGVNAISLRFDYGKRIVGLPGRTDDTVRGFSSVGLLIFEEAARVPDELYHGLRPLLAVGNGALWLMSTPNGRTGFFYHEWTHGTGWERITVPATECPRISPEFLEEERASKGEELFRQEYLCEFLDSDGTVFDRDLIERAFTAASEPLAPVGTAAMTRALPRGVHLYLQSHHGKLSKSREINHFPHMPTA